MAKDFILAIQQNQANGIVRGNQMLVISRGGNYRPTLGTALQVWRRQACIISSIRVVIDASREAALTMETNR